MKAVMLITVTLLMFSLNSIILADENVLLDEQVQDAPKQSCSAGSCHGGRDGRDGHPGHPGRDGRDGCPGAVGAKGKDGNNGTNGVDGKDGINGKDGIPGKNGTDGINGNDGKGTSRNTKQCAWNSISGSDSYDATNIGKIKDCRFSKKVASSQLMVTVTTTICVFHCAKCCKRWFITFDGLECSPVPIDLALFRNAKTTDYVPLTLKGLCKVNKVGTVNVGFNIGNCRNMGDADGDTGYKSTTRILIEEIES